MGLTGVSGILLNLPAGVKRFSVGVGILGTGEIIVSVLTIAMD